MNGWGDGKWSNRSTRGDWGNDGGHKPGVDTTELDQVSRAIKAIDFGLYLEIKAVKGF